MTTIGYVALIALIVLIVSGCLWMTTLPLSEDGSDWQ